MSMGIGAGIPTSEEKNEPTGRNAALICLIVGLSCESDCAGLGGCDWIIGQGLGVVTIMPSIRLRFSNGKG